MDPASHNSASRFWGFGLHTIRSIAPELGADGTTLFLCEFHTVSAHRGQSLHTRPHGLHSSCSDPSSPAMSLQPRNESKGTSIRTSRPAFWKTWRTGRHASHKRPVTGSWASKMHYPGSRRRGWLQSGRAPVLQTPGDHVLHGVENLVPGRAKYFRGFFPG